MAFKKGDDSKKGKIRIPKPDKPTQINIYVIDQSSKLFNKEIITHLVIITKLKMAFLLIQ